MSKIKKNYNFFQKCKVRYINPGQSYLTATFVHTSSHFFLRWGNPEGKTPPRGVHRCTTVSRIILSQMLTPGTPPSLPMASAMRSWAEAKVFCWKNFRKARATAPGRFHDNVAVEDIAGVGGMLLRGLTLKGCGCRRAVDDREIDKKGKKTARPGGQKGKNDRPAGRSKEQK